MKTNVKPGDDDYTCDVCGKPATSFARDYYRYMDINDAPFVKSEPVTNGRIACGCDDHPAQSTAIDLGIVGLY